MIKSLSKEISIAYLGNIGFIYDFDSLFEIMLGIQKKRRVTLHIIGSGPNRNWLFNQLKNISRESIAKKSLIKNGILIYTNSDNKIIEVVNKIAPEHLELNIKNFKSLLPKIKNSGSICLGRYAVMAMTDYNVGSNHILPTNGSSKYSSGISVNEFYKRISYVNLSKKGIESLGPSVITLANYEGLKGHAQSIKKRIKKRSK